MISTNRLLEIAVRLGENSAGEDDIVIAREELSARAAAGNTSARELLRRAGWDGRGRPGDAIIGKALQAVLDIQGTSEATRLLSRSQLVEELYRRAVERADARAAGEPLGPEVAAVSPTLHRVVEEGLPVGITTVDGGPGAGKTAFALQIAMTSRVPALIVECEVQPVRILERMIASQTATYLGKLKDGALTPDAIRGLAERTFREVPMVEIVDATADAVAMDVIVKEACALRERHGAKHAVVVLDSLHAWSARALKADKEYDRLTKAIRLVDGAAKGAGISVIAVLERSLATMQSPSATSGKGHAGIGYAGEVALNLDARSATNPTSGKKRIDLRVSKNRWGEQGFVIPMEFEGRLQRLTELEITNASSAAVEAIANGIFGPSSGIYDDGESLNPATGEPFPAGPSGFEDRDLFGAD